MCFGVQLLEKTEYGPVFLTAEYREKEKPSGKRAFGMLLDAIGIKNGGERGIRTLGGV